MALEVIQALNKKITASKFFNVFKKTPQILENIKFKDKDILKKSHVKDAIKIAEKLIKSHGRILVRKSGTEPIIRIMGESTNKILLKKCIKKLKKQLVKLKPKSKILIIAGSDSSGGAGIQADIKTITNLGSYAMSAVTAVTVQNTRGVKSVIPIHANEIENQIIYTSKDIKPDAIKIGMLHSSRVVKKVLKALSKIKVKKIVLDPVMFAKSGTKLIDFKAINLLKKKLVSQVTLITPNIPEAEVLTNMRIKNINEMILAGKILLNYGVKNVLIKGGHLKSKNVSDILINEKEIKVFKSYRHKTKNTHGTGCTLSSAITTFISCGKSIKKACDLGIKYVNLAILTNPKYGKVMVQLIILIQ